MRQTRKEFNAKPRRRKSETKLQLGKIPVLCDNFWTQRVSMKVNQFLALAAIAFCGAFTSSAQTWTQRSAPIANWSGLAMSADGTKLVAVVGGGVSVGSIYTSTDSGVTWISNNAPKLDWIAVCSSADGLELAANEYGRGTWTNSGTSWTQTPCPVDSFYPSSIASSADGNTLIGGANSLYLSTNHGNTWVINSTTPKPIGEGCAMSADAITMLVNGAPYLSTNSGATWIVATNLQTEMRAAATSADGMKLFAMGDAGVWASMNGGALWFKLTNAPTSSYGSIASSADGTRLILARRITSSALFISTNSGLAWTTANVPSNTWCSVASSADGNTLAAAIKGGGIWIAKSTPTPELTIEPTDGLQLSWLIPSTNFVLQQSPDLSSWSDVTNVPVLNLTNLQNQVTLPLSADSSFYRLKTP
jgi:hypothetical protein